jgi:hypothetical protein
MQCLRNVFLLLILCDATADNICEGFDHPEAPATDLAAAAAQLRSATACSRW